MARGSVVAAVTLVSLCLLLPVASSVGRTEVEDRELYRAWLARHSRPLGGDVDHDDGFQAFCDNAAFIEEHNRAATEGGGGGYLLAPKAFADQTSAQFRSTHLGLGSGFPGGETTGAVGERYGHGVADASLPTSVDWRNEGAVAAVKSQGTHCGSCWAFAAVAAVESANKLANGGELIPLSEQEIMDCSHNGTAAFDYIATNGVCTEAAYPYTASDGTCQSCPKAVGIKGFTSLPANDQTAIMVSVASQPLVVLIDANAREFQFYSSGIYTGPCGTNLNHAVVIVGYGDDAGKPFWLVRNSWGTHWGEDGYVRIQRMDGAGLCGMNLFPSFPIPIVPNPKLT